MHNPSFWYTKNQVSLFYLASLFGLSCSKSIRLPHILRNINMLGSLNRLLSQFLCNFTSHIFLLFIKAKPAATFYIKTQCMYVCMCDIYIYIYKKSKKSYTLHTNHINTRICYPFPCQHINYVKMCHAWYQQTRREKLHSEGSRQKVCKGLKVEIWKKSTGLLLRLRAPLSQLLRHKQCFTGKNDNMKHTGETKDWNYLWNTDVSHNRGI